MGFHGIGAVVRDSEWDLPEDDASVLAERAHNWLRSLDRKKAAKWEKSVARWQPFLMLLMAIIAIVIPRITHTLQVRKDARNLRKEPQDGNASGSGAARVASVPVVPVGDIHAAGAGQNGNGRNGAERSGPPVFHPLPFNRKDWTEPDSEIDI